MLRGEELILGRERPINSADIENSSFRAWCRVRVRRKVGKGTRISFSASAGVTSRGDNASKVLAASPVLKVSLRVMFFDICCASIPE
jgi:hypothetical protein